ncbi:MAG: hypothetical protein A3E88_05065 [Legionellales bacterium RIFCSPHIGHO2_12_FULL_35_11]|nr:MAG: hypothetical protein A3E88_05065 [Legionellales bacterium RIFCSPHIGHO2_12_FULL_35_11]
MKRSNQYSLPVGKSDLERMTMLGSIYNPFCYNFLLKSGLKPGLKVADIGCGPGNVTLWLSEQVGSTGKIIGVDHSGEQLELLNKIILEKEIHNVSTYKIDIYNIDQIQESFDIIFCRFLFIHLSQPLVAIQKLHSLLKPGGCLIMAELDNSTWFSYPEHDALLKDTKLLCEVGEKKGMDFCIGPKLYGYLRKEVFADISVQIAQPILSGKDRQYVLLKSQTWANVYLEHELISKINIQNMLTHLAELVHNDDYLMAGAKMYLACGKKSI